MTARGAHADRPSRLVMARSRGAIAGPLLVVLGAWGALIPFFGHSFGYGFGPNETWTWSAARGWLEVAPGVAALVGGLVLTTSGNRLSALVGGWIAAAGGAWFVIGRDITAWWNPGTLGAPRGTANHAVWEQLGMFDGLGVVIVVLAAIAIGRFTVVGVRDLAAAESRREAAEADANRDINLDATPAAPPNTTPAGESTDATSLVPKPIVPSHI